jgi:hypothetical protein
MLRSTVPGQEKLLDDVFVGGNHLALHIGSDPPHYTASSETALQHYGAGILFDIWCAWAAIMRLANGDARLPMR